MVLWKEYGRDGAIAFPFNPGIDGAQHLAEALTPLRRDAGVRWCRRLAQAAPVASKRFQTVWRRIVKQNERSRGPAGAAAPHQLDADDLIAESNALMADTRRIGLGSTVTRFRRCNPARDVLQYQCPRIRVRRP